MRKTDEAYRSMVEELLLMLTKFIAVWQGNKLMEGAVTVIRAKIKEITKYLHIQKYITKDLGKIKKESRDTLNKSTFIIYGIIRTYALSIGDKKLAADYKISISKIARIKDTSMESFVESTQETVDKYKDELMQHGLTQKMLEKYGKEADGFIDALSAPGEAKKERKYATERISELIKEMRNVLDNQMDTYVIQYMNTNPEFYRTYQFARIIYDNPSQHYSMIGIVDNEATGKPERNVTVTVQFVIEGKIVEYVKTTSANGIFIFKSLPQDKCKVIFTKNYFDDLTVDSEVYDNQTTKLDVAIRKTE